MDLIDKLTKMKEQIKTAEKEKTFAEGQYQQPGHLPPGAQRSLQQPAPT